ncbi:uncharacterized protein LOC135099886 isoform X2 [Scylla paramamosain]|uniref:uncharacterized protein LOC135099886 isoform X2 n=1 Tax=Scylla paramamosain TaxID=85552 RepID=UPI003083AEBF
MPWSQLLVPPHVAMDHVLEVPWTCCGSSVVFPATMDLEFYGDQHKPAARMSATKKVKFSLELPGVVKQEPVDASYDAPADPHCVPSAAGRPQQAMQKVPDITELSDPESSLGK